MPRQRDVTPSSKQCTLTENIIAFRQTNPVSTNGAEVNIFNCIADTTMAVQSQEASIPLDINKFSTQGKILNERKMIKEKDKKIVTTTVRSVQPFRRKPGTRSRKKLSNHSEVINFQTASPEEENLNHKLTEHFAVDETPVAVPVHGPPTPHRINMPDRQPEDPCENNIITQREKTPMAVVVSQSIQSPMKKIAARGRKKGGNHNVGRQGMQSMNIESTNHKLTDYFPVRRSERKCKKTVLQEKQRDLENKVLSQVEEGLKVRHFPGKGRGVVTTREFSKGEFVVEYIGELIDQVTAKKREALYALDQNTGCYMYYFQHRNHQYCVDATKESGKLGRLVNHSRNGNLIARVIEVDSIPHLVLTAKEDIPVGVEVTYDYGDRSREAIRNHPWLAL